MRSVTLIGMPGSGKSAVGRIIAGRLGWSFVDTDKEIERKEGGSLQEVINRLGEEAFRRLEEETVLGLTPGGPAVISTGGSVIYSARAMRHLSSISAVVFLDAPLEAIRTHIEAEAPRGIVGMPEGGLEGLYLERDPLYRRYAEVTVTLQRESAEEAAELVLSRLGLDREEG